MRFLHISDLHFNPDCDGEATRTLRKKFEDYVQRKKITDINEIFFTGDFRSAQKQTGQDMEKVAQNAVNFLKFIAKCVGVDGVEHIHIVPGNHDLDRYLFTDDKQENERQKKNAERKLRKIYEKYDKDAGQFLGNVDGIPAVDYLWNRFIFFKKCAEFLENKIWNELPDGKIHHYQRYQEYGILYVNTAIASGRDSDRNNLIIGSDDFEKEISKAEGKPLFILAHNPIDHLEHNEKRKIQSIMNEVKSPVVWFCGDIHEGDYYNNYATACIAAGCMIKERGTEASFYVGEFENSQFTYFMAHGYKAEHRDWQPEEALAERIKESIPKSLCNFKSVFSEDGLNQNLPHERLSEELLSKNMSKQDIFSEETLLHKNERTSIVKYFVMLGIIRILVGVSPSILVRLDEKQTEKTIEPIVPTEMVLESEELEKVGLLGIDVTPLSMFESNLEGEEIYKNRYVEKKYAKEGFDKGCVLKTTVTNRKEDSVEISDVTLVIDEIKRLEQVRSVVLGYMYNNKLEIYLINDGKKNFSGKVQLSFKYYDEELGTEDYLEDYIIERILSPRVFGKYEELQGGEICRIAQYDISCTELQNWMKEHYENSGIYIVAKVVDGYSGREYEYDLGCMYAASSNRACLEWKQGEEYEYPVDNPIVLDPNMENVSSYETGMDYNLESNGTQNIQIVMLATESCEVTFHAAISTKDGETVITDQFQEKIFVPLYKNGKQNQYSKVMQYLVWHNISEYYYNQDISIQENIAYRLEDMINKENYIISESPDVELSTENISKEIYKITPLQDYDSYGLFGEVLRQYYEVAASIFSWETIQTKIYVNEGASNYYNSESYAVYFRFIDLADDGSPELVIAIDQEDDPMNIVDIFTIENDKIVRIIDNDGSVSYRNRYYICKDKTIKNIESGGVLNSQIEFFKLLADSSELIPVDSYVYNGWDGEYYSHINSMGEETTISLENMDEVNNIDDEDHTGEWTLLYERIPKN